jgi:hypothetical protein
MLKLLIIPDIHNHFEPAEALIRLFPDRQVVFLGDYFDSFNDTPSMAAKTAEWLSYSIKEGRVHLMGNHDLPYRWRYQTCPGYHARKDREVKRFMNEALWNETRLVLIYSTGDSLDARPLVLSHAGLTLANLYGADDCRDVARGGRLEFLRDRLPQEHLEEIRTQATKCQRAAKEVRHHFWLNQGTRVGDRNVGGPFWIDRHELRSPLPGIDQIVGHTHVTKPQRHCMPHVAKPSSEVWFIDGGGKLAALVDGVVTERGGLQITPIHAIGEKIGEPVLPL